MGCVRTCFLRAGGAAARPFTVHYHALDATFYLRIADELYLKRCLVGGLDRVYEISKDFRNEGLSRFHNPEFTMAEWYQAYADYHDMLALTEELVAGLVAELFETATLERSGTAVSSLPVTVSVASPAKSASAAPLGDQMTGSCPRLVR